MSDECGGKVREEDIKRRRARVTRRRSLQVAAVSATGAVAFTGCQAPTHSTPLREFVAQSRVRLAEDLVSANENWYASVCRGCEAGCGIVVRVVDGRAKKVEGNPDHPVNRGKLCARGQAIVQEQYHPDRLRGPQVLRNGPASRGTGPFDVVAWDAALSELAGRLRDVSRRGGPPGQVVMITPQLSGHLTLLVDRFTRALGAQWLVLDTLAEAPLRQAMRLFSQERLPRFDVENARYVLSFGADWLGSWLSPVQYEREYGVFRQGSYRAGSFAPRETRPRGYLAHVDSHFSRTAANADEWIPVAPGREEELALSIAQVILSEGLADRAGAPYFGDPRGLDAYAPERIAPEVGGSARLTAERIRQVARAFAAQRPSLAIAGGSVGAHPNGTQALTAVLALNLLVGAVGAPGGLHFAPPPDLDDQPVVLPAVVPPWQDLVARLRAGQVDTVLVYGADPVHGLPASLGFSDALLRARQIVSFSSFLDDTSALADLLLPSHLPLEDWGTSVPQIAATGTVTVQQPVVEPLYETRSFGETLLRLAAQIGAPVSDALPWATTKDVVREAAHTLHALDRGSVREATSERFWTRLLQQGGWWDEPAPTGPAPAPASFVDVGELQRAMPRAAPSRAGSTDPEYPFALVLFEHNTLGAGEAAHLPWLQAAPDPITSVTWQTWVEVNPGVAKARGLREGDLVRVESAYGKVDVPVYVSPAAAPDVLAMPLGQGHRAFGRWAEGRGANPIDLLGPETDQTTGALAWGATRVRMVKTGRRVPLPKLEGTVPAYQLPGEESKVIKVSRQ